MTPNPSPTDRARPLAACLAFLLAVGACDTAGPPDPTLFQVPIEGVRGTDWFYGALPNHSGEWTVDEDYTCGPKTRDFHTTTDFIIPSFTEMLEGVDALAAAPGVVIEVHDGEPDGNLAYQLGLEDNRVVIEHPDGIQSAYRNLKAYSIQVQVGEEVEAGQVIGQAGSSGESDWPRVGFEARTGNGDPFDPWAGDCSPGSTFWVDQPQYPNEFYVIDSGITNQGSAQIAARPPDVDTVAVGELLGFWAHVLNRPAGTVTVRVMTPTATLDSTHAFDQPDPANRLFRGWVQLYDGVPLGTWAIEYDVNGETIVHMEVEVVDSGAARAAGTARPAVEARLFAPEPDRRH